MAPTVIRDVLRQIPFRPFRVVQTDGATYDIRHPDNMALTLTAAVVGVYGQQSADIPERFVTLDLIHIVRLEPLPAPAQAGNGQ